MDIKDRLEELAEQPDVYQQGPISTVIQTVPVQAYRCPGCRKIYINKLSAIRHLDKCVKNPLNKTCMTCANRIVLHESVCREDRCHCTIEDGEALIDKAKYVDTSNSYNGNDYYYTGHDIVWNCKHYVHGRCYFVGVHSYSQALDAIDKYNKRGTQ